MKILCQQFQDFIENLEILQTDDQIHMGEIRKSILYSPKDSFKRGVVLTLSTVILKKEGNEFLLEYTEFCGTDLFDSVPDLSGSHYAEMLIDQLVSSAPFKSRGLKLVPGLIVI